MAKTNVSDLVPFAVTLNECRRLCGGESRQSTYEAIGRGDLVAVKRGKRTLVTTASIRRRMENLPRAQIKSPSTRTFDLHAASPEA